MTILLLIRHGENDFTGKRLIGRLPGVSLNERGREQAAQICNTLADAPIKAIYSSPLERAMETAAPLAARLGLEVQPHPSLLEVDFGDYQGKTAKQLPHLKDWKQVQQHPSTYTFPHGESFTAASQRAVTALHEIAGKHGEKDLVACFSHHDTIALAITAILDMPLDSFHKLSFGTASISILWVWKDARRVLRLNWQPGLDWPKE
jgi:probable phosphoglycerate mutase